MACQPQRVGKVIGANYHPIMSKKSSDIKIINAMQSAVWGRISDLSQLQAIKDNMPAEQKAMIKEKLREEAQGKLEISDVFFTEDLAQFKVSGMEMALHIVERQEPMKCVKFEAQGSPVPVTLWIQLLPEGPYQTRCKVTLDVDVPFFLKPMVGNKLDKAADQIAEMLCRIPY